MSDEIKCPLCRGSWQFYPVGPFRRDTIYVDPYRVSVGPPLRPLSDPELKILELEMELYRERKLRLEVAKVRNQYWRRAEAAEKRIGIFAGLRRLFGAAMVLLLTAILLTACGGEPEAESQVRVCSEMSGSVESESFCLSRFDCQPGEPRFRGHMCMCWEKTCLCFVSRSTKPCDTPDEVRDRELHASTRPGRMRT